MNAALITHANPRRSILASLLMGAGLLVAVPAAAELARSERDFVEKMAHANLAAIESAQLAERKADSPAIRAYAASMLKLHQSLQSSLSSIARSKGVQLPRGADLPQRARRMQISGSEGAAFDTQYIKDQGIDAHDNAWLQLRNAAADARDPEIRDYAAQALPQIKQALDAARALYPGLAR